MQSFRGTLVTVAALAVLAITGCDDPLNPCPIESFVDSDFLDGTWNAELINGNPIPQSGFKADTKNFVKASSIEFHTSYVEGGKCLAPKSMSGVALVRYKLVDEVGFPKDSKTYMASFDYDVKPGDLTLRVDTKLASGERVAPKVLTVDPVTPAGWAAMSIVFTR